MAELVKDRTNLPELVAVAGRINASQADEIAFMQNWLRERGESVPDASMHRGMDMKGTMAGMASPADMARLATLKGADFDRLFLTLMIAHHDGALKMVDALVKKARQRLRPGAVPVHERREDRTEGRDRPDERAPGHPRDRPPRGAFGRVQGRRTGGEPSGAGRDARQTHRLLRSDQRRRICRSPRPRRRTREPSPPPPTARPTTAPNGATVPRCSPSRRPTWRSPATCW